MSEMPHKEFKRMLIKKKFNEIQENTDKWLNETRKTMQDRNEKFCKEIRGFGKEPNKCLGNEELNKVNLKKFKP
jgi:hypothetical protein